MRQGVPVELTFDRQESGACTSRVVFPDFRASATLPAHQRTTVRLDPGQAGEFGFACGMNIIHGTLLVEPAADGAPGGRPDPAAMPVADGVTAGASRHRVLLLGRVRRRLRRRTGRRSCRGRSRWQRCRPGPHIAHVPVLMDRTVWAERILTRVR